MKTVCVLQARMDSKRLPGKALLELCGKPILEHIIDRIKATTLVEKIVLATTERSCDDKIAQLATKAEIDVYRGSVDDVLGRVTRAALEYKPDLVVNATGDNPLIAPEFIDFTIAAAKKKESDLCFISGIPLGSGVDVFSMKALLKSSELAREKKNREHVNSFIFDNVKDFNVEALSYGDSLYSQSVRLTVDTPEDLKLVKRLYEKLYKKGKIVLLRDVMLLYEENINLFEINSSIEQLYVSSNVKELRF